MRFTSLWHVPDSLKAEFLTAACETPLKLYFTSKYPELLSPGAAFQGIKMLLQHVVVCVSTVV